MCIQGDIFSYDWTETAGLNIPMHTLKPPQTSQLHSSFIPCPEDEANVAMSIADINASIRSVDDEITRVQHVLMKLGRCRDGLQQNILKHRAIIAPVRRLPPEILALVFSFATNDCVVEWPPPPGHTMPWVLGKVCSYWRLVLLSLPRPWSEIHMDLFCLNNQLANSLSLKLKLRHAEEFLDTCLHRSANELLRFKIMGQGADDATRSILGILVEHSERWKEAYFIFDIYRFSPIFSRAKHRLGNLSTLTIKAFDQPEPPIIINAFEDAPKLHEVSIEYVLNPFQSLVLPWSQITDLKSSRNLFGEGEFTQILRQTTNIVSLSTETERILEVTSQPVFLPHLTSLSIMSKGTYIAKVFQVLTIPNLKNLSIFAITPFLGEQTVPMLVRSGCRPTSLKFTSSLSPNACWEENIGIVWMLISIPSLTDLDLTVIRSSDEIMPRLLFRPGMDLPLRFLPNISNLALDDRLCLSAEKVIDAICSRIENGQGGLRKITLKLSRPLPPTFSELHKLRAVAEEHGVGITIEAN